MAGSTCQTRAADVVDQADGPVEPGSDDLRNGGAAWQGFARVHHGEMSTVWSDGQALDRQCGRHPCCLAEDEEQTCDVALRLAIIGNLRGLSRE